MLIFFMFHSFNKHFLSRVPWLYPQHLPYGGYSHGISKVLAFLELTDGWERRPLNKSTINNYSLERAMMKIGSYKNESWTGGTDCFS